MRVDIRKPTPEEQHDLHRRAYLPGFAVLLDGYKVNAVVALDTEEGWVEHYLMDGDGRLHFDERGDGVLGRKTGHVEIRLPRDDGTIEIINPQPEFYRG